MRDRFFVEGVHGAGARVPFAADDARKLVNVLRKRSGDRVQVVDSGGAAYAATLEVDGRSVHAVLDAPLPGAVESALAITLAQAVPKGQKMDAIVEKSTELGVHEIVPLRTQRVIAAAGAAKLERWRRIARAAAQQSGRTRIPPVAVEHDWDALLARVGEFDRVYVPWELAEPAPLRQTLERDLEGVRSVLIAIGPEGGLAADEVERAVRAGARAISLGRRILRTETAPIVMLSALLYARGEL